MIFALFSGFYANSDLVPAALAWISYVSPIRYAFTGLMIVLVGPMTFDCSDALATGCVPTGQDELSRLGIQGDSFSRSAGVLFALTVGFNLIGLTILSVNRASWVTPKKEKVN